MIQVVLRAGALHNKRLRPYVWRKLRLLGIILSLVTAVVKLVVLVAEHQLHRVPTNCAATTESREVLMDASVLEVCTTPLTASR